MIRLLIEGVHNAPPTLQLERFTGKDPTSKYNFEDLTSNEEFELIINVFISY